MAAAGLYHIRDEFSVLAEATLATARTSTSSRKANVPGNETSRTRDADGKKEINFGNLPLRWDDFQRINAAEVKSHLQSST